MGDELKMGDLADLPTPRRGLAEKFYYAEDTGQLFVTDGVAWTEVVTEASPLLAGGGWDLVAAYQVDVYNSPAALVGATPGPANSAGPAANALQPGGIIGTLANTGGATPRDFLVSAFFTTLTFSEPGGGLSISAERLATLGFTNDTGQARTLRPVVPQYVTPTPGPFGGPRLDGGTILAHYEVGAGDQEFVSMNDLVYVASPDAPGPITFSPAGTYSTMIILGKNQ